MSASAPLAEFDAAVREGRYFEAHEILEAFWVVYHGADRDFYRGLIQAAVALHHHRAGNQIGASGVASRARRHLVPYAPAHEGVDVSALLARLDRMAS